MWRLLLTCSDRAQVFYLPLSVKATLEAPQFQLRDTDSEIQRAKRHGESRCHHFPRAFGGKARKILVLSLSVKANEKYPFRCSYTRRGICTAARPLSPNRSSPTSKPAILLSKILEIFLENGDNKSPASGDCFDAHIFFQTSATKRRLFSEHTACRYRQFTSVKESGESPSTPTG